ncbi:hypothetical protein J2W83_001169 [Pseudomonas hunanensis]|uniref:Uncharacterized protein n=1 Tax=Pseudomonas hunanensis TaxID=1247546 RepID=A0ACC6JZH0_9PSED|nr:hypothetical protein [Pseudomonas hunanensis]
MPIPRPNMFTTCPDEQDQWPLLVVSRYRPTAATGRLQPFTTACIRPIAAIAKVLFLLIFRGRREPCGRGFIREAGNAEDGTGFARVRGHACSQSDRANSEIFNKTVFPQNLSCMRDSAAMRERAVVACRRTFERRQQASMQTVLALRSTKRDPVPSSRARGSRSSFSCFPARSIYPWRPVR